MRRTSSGLGRPHRMGQPQRRQRAEQERERAERELMLQRMRSVIPNYGM